MSKFFILIASFLVSFNTFSQNNDSASGFTEKLEFSAFKGTPDNDSLGAAISTYLFLKTEKINIWNGTIHFKAYALMNPFKSWVKPGYADEAALQHEQTHFNITEICARNLQAELNRMKIRSPKSPLVQTTFDKWERKKDELQVQYDKETKGGSDPVIQHQWNEKVLAELKKTSRLLPVK